MPIRTAVFPVAGLGTRFLPATRAVPKEMLPLVDRPVIQYGVEEAVASGIDRIVLVTAKGKEAIEAHFGDAAAIEATLDGRGRADLLARLRAVPQLADLTSVIQERALGLGHAVGLARDAVGDQPFAVFLADDVIVADPPCMKQMADLHRRLGGSILAVEPIAAEHTDRYGIIKGTAIEAGVWRVEDLVEKPAPADAPSNLAIIGRYILEPQIFAHLDKTTAGAGGEIQLTDGLRSLLAERPVHACRFAGTRYDTGDRLGFLQATVAFALRRHDLGGPFREWLASLDLGGR